MGSIEIGDLISEQISIGEDNDERTNKMEEMQLNPNEETNIEITTESVHQTKENRDIQVSNGDENEK